MLFTLAEIWRQPKCPSTDEWIMKMWNIYIILLNHKNNKISPFATTWMDLEITILSEISETEKDTHCIISLICGI